MKTKIILFTLLILASKISLSENNEKTYNEIIENLRCLVCQNQSLSESDSKLAKDLRTKVKQMLSEGKTDKYIYKFMSDRYTDYVLYNPPVKGSTFLLWYGPFIILAIALFYIFFLARKKILDKSINFTSIKNYEKKSSNSSFLEKKYLKIFIIVLIPIFAVSMYINSSDYMKYKISHFFKSKAPIIDVTIVIHEEILPKITGNEFLFVYARKSNGMRAPLAIEIFNVEKNKRNYNVKLDNTMNMLQNHTLSSAKEVIVEARISKVKKAMVMPGDFIGMSAPFGIEASNYLLLKINSIVTEE